MKYSHLSRSWRSQKLNGTGRYRTEHCSVPTLQTKGTAPYRLLLFAFQNRLFQNDQLTIGRNRNGSPLLFNEETTILFEQKQYKEFRVDKAAGNYYNYLHKIKSTP